MTYIETQVFMDAVHELLATKTRWGRVQLIKELEDLILRLSTDKIPNLQPPSLDIEAVVRRLVKPECLVENEGAPF